MITFYEWLNLESQEEAPLIDDEANKLALIKRKSIEPINKIRNWLSQPRIQKMIHKEGLNFVKNPALKAIIRQYTEPIQHEIISFVLQEIKKLMAGGTISAPTSDANELVFKAIGELNHWLDKSPIARDLFNRKADIGEFLPVIQRFLNRYTSDIQRKIIHQLENRIKAVKAGVDVPVATQVLNDKGQPVQPKASIPIAKPIPKRA